MICKLLFLSIVCDINSSITTPASFTMIAALSLKYVMLFWKLEKPRNIIFEIKTMYILQLGMYHDKRQKVLNILQLLLLGPRKAK